MIIVTGAAGFIGSNLVAGLNARGVRDIIAVDDLTNGDKHRNLNALAISDYLDKDQLLNALPGLGKVEAIFHQGACSSTTERDGKYMMANNYEYSKRLLASAAKQRMPFLYASSAAVYGTGAHGFREEPACENPMNVYAYSKLAFDNWVRRHISSFSAPVVGFRYFNVYGPQENHKGDMASVAYKLFEQRASNKPLGLFEGSDEILRDFVYVGDCVAVNLSFFERPQSGVFNVGTGKARSFGDVGRIAVSLVGGQVEHVPMPDHLRGKYQRFTEADLTGLRAAGYDAPFVELEEGMKRYYESLKERGGYLGAP